MDEASDDSMGVAFIDRRRFLAGSFGAAGLLGGGSVASAALLSACTDGGTPRADPGSTSRSGTTDPPAGAPTDGRADR